MSFIISQLKSQQNVFGVVSRAFVFNNRYGKMSYLIVLIFISFQVLSFNINFSNGHQTCKHFYPKYYDNPAPVKLGGKYVKRDIASQTEEPMRIRVFYHKSLEDLKKKDRNRIKNVVSFTFFSKPNLICFRQIVISDYMLNRFSVKIRL